MRCCKIKNTYFLKSYLLAYLLTYLLVKKLLTYILKTHSKYIYKRISPASAWCSPQNRILLLFISKKLPFIGNLGRTAPLYIK